MTAEPPGPDDPLLGSVIDRYRVVSRLGDGGMGIVYQVEHIHLSKLVAMKVMRPTRDTVDRQRFEQEARLASKIRHKNVVEISDFGSLPTGQPYFVMEFLRGQTLGDAIYEGRIDPLLACHIAAQIASGLQAVHKQNVVHRDLKPDNIFLIDPDDNQQDDPDQSTESGEFAEVHFVKIMDFGIAKSIDKNLTGTGMTLGTPEYMSPEQATGMKIDWRSDQYSLGCMLYEMLTGDLPFPGKGAFEIMNKHISEPPTPLRKRRPDIASSITPALEKIVLTMIQKKPHQRFPTMRAVELALRETVTLMRQSTATVVTPPPTVRTQVLPKPSDPNAPPGATPEPVADIDTLPQPAKRPASEARTMPFVAALPPAPAPEPTTKPPSSRDAKTLVMMSASDWAEPPTAMPGPAQGQTPTPHLLMKLAVKIHNSAPQLARPRRWQNLPSLLRSFLSRCTASLRRLFRR